MFADYRYVLIISCFVHNLSFNRVPQALVYFGVLEYTDNLTSLLKSDPFLPKGSREEIEIRGNSIWSVELVKEEMNRLIQSKTSQKIIHLNAIIIDFYLWDYAKAHSEDMNNIPIHKTRTIFY